MGVSSPLLPQYQRLANDDIDDLPLPPKSDAQPTYPPSAGPSSGESNVTYIFVPRRPIKGERESVLGVLGVSKAVSDGL